MLKCSAGKRRWQIRKSCEEGGSVGPILCHQGWGHLAERCGQPRRAVQLLAPKPWVLRVPQGPRLCCTRTPAAACPLPWALTSPRLSPGASPSPRSPRALLGGTGPGAAASREGLCGRGASRRSRGGAGRLGQGPWAGGSGPRGCHYGVRFGGPAGVHAGARGCGVALPRPRRARTAALPPGRRHAPPRLSLIHI